MDQAPAPEGLPPSLRFLKFLVVTLTLTMIVGVIVIVAVIVTRMPSAIRTTLPLPESITLPEGTRAAAVTQGSDWFAIVTTDDRILIYDRASGAVKQEVRISPTSP